MLFNLLQDMLHVGGSSIQSDQFQFQVVVLGIDADWYCKNNLQRNNNSL